MSPRLGESRLCPGDTRPQNLGSALLSSTVIVSTLLASMSLILSTSQSLTNFGSLIGGTLNLALVRETPGGGDPAGERLVKLEVVGPDEVHPHDWGSI